MSNISDNPEVEVISMDVDERGNSTMIVQGKTEHLGLVAPHIAVAAESISCHMHNISDEEEERDQFAIIAEGHVVHLEGPPEWNKPVRLGVVLEKTHLKLLASTLLNVANTGRMGDADADA